MDLYRPKFLYSEGTFHEDHEMAVNAQGQIAWLGPVGKNDANAHQIHDWPQEAIIPGLINAHSHAFQWILRGHTQNSHPDHHQAEGTPPGRGRAPKAEGTSPGRGRAPKAEGTSPGRGRAPIDNFWTWRQAMYQAVENLDPEDVYTITALCYAEMLASGITSVGEFHYLHHQKDAKAYNNANEMGLAVIRAAQDTGMRLCLLDVAYGRGGYQKEVSNAQKRFTDTSIDAYLERLETLEKEIPKGFNWGMAIHSIRAVDETWLKAIQEFIENRAQCPLHMHLHEQMREIEECQNEYGGLTPIEVVHDLGLMQKERPLTAVHATHINERDIDLLKKGGSTVCACPTTERDLGDGILEAQKLWENKIPICLGSDSQVLINLFEDARELEYHLRLKTYSRNVLCPKPAPELLKSATENGAIALKIPAGNLVKDKQADFVRLDLNHLSLLGGGHEAQSLTTDIIFSMNLGAIKRVYVGGQASKPLQEKWLKDFKEIKKKTRL